MMMIIIKVIIHLVLIYLVGILVLSENDPFLVILATFIFFSKNAKNFVVL